MNKGTTGSVEWMVTVCENCELGLEKTRRADGGYVANTFENMLRTG